MGRNIEGGRVGLDWGKKDEKRGIAAASFSSVGPFLLGHRLKLKQAPKALAAMSFMLFTIKKNAVGKDFNPFLMDIPSF